MCCAALENERSANQRRYGIVHPARPAYRRPCRSRKAFSRYVGHCLIFNGKPGRGKTRLAIAIAYRAIQHGFDALFVTAAELIDDLSAAFRVGRFAAALATYTHPSVLVVDEVGYLTCGTDAANVLFHVVNDRHRKKRAMIFATNKPLHQWGHVLHDELAHAIVDRVLERGRFLTLDGPSMRTKHLGLDDPTAPEASSDQPARIPDRQVIRISGIDAPEFPEPTKVVQLVEEYSDPNIGGALGLQGEALVLEGFARSQFVMRSRDTRSHGGRSWTQSDHDLDFVFERDDRVYGVEVKNTLRYIDYTEFSTKVQMCRALGIRPVFAVRMLPIHEVIGAGGFALILKHQLYPWAHRDLARRVKAELGLPVDAPRALEGGTMARFLRWHQGL